MSSGQTEKITALYERLSRDDTQDRLKAKLVEAILKFRFNR